MSADTPALPRARLNALRELALSVVANIPGADFASITLYGDDRSLRTIGATDPLAEEIDALQYELREGPCYAAITEKRLVLLHDVARAEDYPRYGPRAGALGVAAQAAVQLTHDGDRAGLNLYSRTLRGFDSSTVLWAELFATQAAALLSYAHQVDQLGEGLQTRTDIGTAVGILMERYRLDQNSAFAFLVRTSNDRNLKIRALALHVIDGTFRSTTAEDGRALQWP